LAVLRPTRQHVAVSPRAGAGDEHIYGPGGLPARALVEHVLRYGCWGVIPVGLGGLLPQRRAACWAGAGAAVGSPR
jgi:hypothetical protein